MGKFSNSSPHPPLNKILARSPDDPQRIRVASVFEFSVCLFSVCLFSVGKFSNFFVQYKAAGVRKNVVRMNTDVLI